MSASSTLNRHDVAAPAAAASFDAAAGARRGAVAVGLVAVAVVHLADLPGKMEEVPYIGWMYVGLMAAALVLAEIVLVKPSRLAFLAAAGLSASTILGFVLTRTTGLPNATDDIGNWTEPLGLVSLMVEAVVVWWALRATRD